MRLLLANQRRQQGRSGDRIASLPSNVSMDEKDGMTETMTVDENAVGRAATGTSAHRTESGPTNSDRPGWSPIARGQGRVLIRAGCRLTAREKQRGEDRSI